MVAAASSSLEDEDWQEALERAMGEIEALQAIYAGDGVQVILQSPAHSEDWEKLRAQLEDDSIVVEEIPTLTIQIRLEQQHENNNGNNTSKQKRSINNAILTCNLPPGYPATASAQVYVTLEKGGGFTRATQEEISSRLRETAEASIGQESLLDIVQVLQDWLAELRETGDDDVEGNDNINDCSDKTSSLENQSNNNNNNNNVASESYGRRWIWVHHITDAGRKKAIVREAQELNLGGFLKAGYPGIVVVEGPLSACDEFVIWIKGNKSRPGGFGRNWGHHVRGEIVMDHTEQQSRLLRNGFQVLDEDLAVLSAACKNHGLEAEFLEYVMQHKVSTTSASNGEVEENGNK